ncbi:F510_1955 family glycosylhydrolase [Actinokineospora sp.]|uniref:F510_1955 family glycosylhydrolase n=1 Tax=Actinokineospora sp. TaxID=1872133 RepID=UPI003D6BF778
MRTSRFLVALAAGLLTACGQTGSPPAQQRPDADRGLAHVHGLGVDPADGTLYAASHHGLFRLPATGKPERVAGNRQDTMGFTIVGPHHFLGSGHPAPGDAGPPHLGLIESTDAGRQWRTLSLAGKADFHSLEAKHNLVYGYDSLTRQLMVSTDKQSWDRRARLGLADFAVSPTDPNVLLATTQQGLARSTDGGRTFTPVPDSPILLLVDWPNATTLVGADPDGALYASPDGGATWSKKGAVPGGPVALTAIGPTDIHVATDAAIHTSHDAGATFPVRRQLS